jgi:hypothetical protein
MLEEKCFLFSALITVLQATSQGFAKMWHFLAHSFKEHLNKKRIVVFYVVNNIV